MKKALCMVLLSTCVAVMLAGCGNTEETTQESEQMKTNETTESEQARTNETTESDYTPVNDDALCGVAYDGYAAEILEYTYTSDWDTSDSAVVSIRFYYENDNDEGLYLLESFGIIAYQDGVELESIGLNSEDEEAQNTIVSVKDGAGIYCLMVFELTSDSDVELVVTEPTAEANVLMELDMPYSLEASSDSDDTQDADAYSYDIQLYSDDYVEITLETLATNSACFSVTNVSDQTIQFDCTYIQLDGLEYSYENTEYASPMETLASGDTRSYEFCDGESIAIENPECGVFTGLFGIWDEKGTLIEYAGIPETTTGLTSESSESGDNGEVLYSDDYVEIAIKNVTTDGAYFTITNKTNDVLQIDCDYIQLDGVDYTYDGSEYGSPLLLIASGGTREYAYVGSTMDGEIIFEIENTEYSEISGVFNVWDGVSGDWITSADI